MAATKWFDDFDSAVEGICKAFPQLQVALDLAIQKDKEYQQEEFLKRTDPEFNPVVAYSKLNAMSRADFLAQGIRRWGYDESGSEVLLHHRRWFGPLPQLHKQWPATQWHWRDYQEMMDTVIYFSKGKYMASVAFFQPSLLMIEAAKAYENGWDMGDAMPDRTEVEAAKYWIAVQAKKLNELLAEVREWNEPEE